MKNKIFSLLLVCALCLGICGTALAAAGGHWENDPDYGPQWVPDTSTSPSPSPSPSTSPSPSPSTSPSPSPSPSDSGGDWDDTPSEPSYSITNNRGKGDHGAWSCNKTSATEGSRVTITVKPDEGYEVGAVTVTDKDGNQVRVTDAGNGKYTFTMPEGRVKVNVEFVATQDTPEIRRFDDVDSSAWYGNAVYWAVEKGITNGNSETANTFGPNEPCTRAQVVTFLWRAAGSPKPTGSNIFTDIAEGTYYYDAVLWAVENGITIGMTDTTFCPDFTCTRAQIVTFLWRYEGTPAASASSTFTDVADGDWFHDAVYWAVSKEITNGNGALDLFDPNGSCTRAQTVTFLYRDMA